MLWVKLKKNVDLGFLPSFISEDNPLPAKDQFDKNYGHGGGWRNQIGFSTDDDNTLYYPGDPPLKPVAITHLRTETICLYPHAYVAIFQLDGSFEVCRMD
jgi:hypothetical protein